MQTTESLSILNIIMLCVGVLITSIGAVLFTKTQRFIRSAQNTFGTIVSNQVSQDEDGTTYKPSFAFTALDGREYRVQSKIGTSSPFEEGQTVHILFDPSFPHQAKINTFVQLWFPSAICAVIGFVFLCFGIFFKTG